MISTIIELFGAQIVIGLLLCACAALIGVILVLKRYSMIGDGLSHVSFSIFAVAMCLNINSEISLLITIPITVLIAYLLLVIGQKTKLKGDSAIALISTSALAISYLVLYTTGNTTNIESFLFGSLITADSNYLFVIIPLTVLIVLFFILYYNRIFSITFDENFAKATGVKTKLYNFIFAAFSAIIISLGMRILGTLLISAIIVFPAISAMRLSNSFKKVLIISVLLSVVAFIVAFFGFYELPVGPAIVCVNFVIFIICSIINFIKKRTK